VIHTDVLESGHDAVSKLEIANFVVVLDGVEPPLAIRFQRHLPDAVAHHPCHRRTQES
jgi:hypothetical protein